MSALTPGAVPADITAAAIHQQARIFDHAPYTEPIVILIRTTRKISCSEQRASQDLLTHSKRDSEGLAITPRTLFRNAAVSGTSEKGWI
ncbi:hypothetical protein [Phyllobacterium leguminum]|uniref:Uncharacterized protein n=1 Tax=Phyllobacterium leguminum TaxID=314237 RepID=A0A318T068_9HYPH|nr:hypothetical protein [Phyllobacterium leguminum]PYE87025.1 hypothetical protein C7477_11766 [Phyllobacterium leguminum]